MERRDPYSDEVTLEIQQGMYGRLARENEDQAAFAYPLYVAVVILPFSFFPYPQAQVPCFSFLVLPTLAVVTIILQAFDWRPAPVGRLVLALWATQRERDLLTGLIRRRYRTPVGFFPAMAVLVLLSLVLLRTWILSLISELSRYQAYAITCRTGESPPGGIVDCLLPSRFSAWATLLLSIAHQWIQSFRGRVDVPRVLVLSIIVTLLIPVWAGTIGEVLFLLPMTYWLSQWSSNWLISPLVASALLVGSWVLSLSTLWRGSRQHHRRRIA